MIVSGISVEAPALDRGEAGTVAAEKDQVKATRDKLHAAWPRPEVRPEAVAAPEVRWTQGKEEAKRELERLQRAIDLETVEEEAERERRGGDAADAARPHDVAGAGPSEELRWAAGREWLREAVVTVGCLPCMHGAEMPPYATAVVAGRATLGQPVMDTDWRLAHVMTAVWLGSLTLEGRPWPEAVTCHRIADTEVRRRLQAGQVLIAPTGVLRPASGFCFLPHHNAPPGTERMLWTSDAFLATPGVPGLIVERDLLPPDLLAPEVDLGATFVDCYLLRDRPSRMVLDPAGLLPFREALVSAIWQAGVLAAAATPDESKGDLGMWHSHFLQQILSPTSDLLVPPTPGGDTLATGTQGNAEVAASGSQDRPQTPGASTPLDAWDHHAWRGKAPPVQRASRCQSRPRTPFVRRARFVPRKRQRSRSHGPGFGGKGAPGKPGRGNPDRAQHNGWGGGHRKKNRGRKRHRWNHREWGTGSGRGDETVPTPDTSLPPLLQYAGNLTATEGHKCTTNCLMMVRYAAFGAVLVGQGGSAWLAWPKQPSSRPPPA